MKFCSKGGKTGTSLGNASALPLPKRKSHRISSIIFRKGPILTKYKSIKKNIKIEPPGVQILKRPYATTSKTEKLNGFDPLLLRGAQFNKI